MLLAALRENWLPITVAASTTKTDATIAPLALGCLAMPRILKTIFLNIVVISSLEFLSDPIFPQRFTGINGDDLYCACICQQL